MARSISQANAARNNSYSGDTYTNSNVSMSSLKSWYNARFYKQTTAKYDSANAGIVNPISLNSDLNNKSWIVIEVAAKGEQHHEYRAHANGRFKMRCYANSSVNARWQMHINSKWYGGKDFGNGKEMQSDNINVIGTNKTGKASASSHSGGKNFTVKLQFSWNGGSTWSEMTGMTTNLSYGSNKCKWQGTAIGGANNSYSSWVRNTLRY